MPPIASGGWGRGTELSRWDLVQIGAAVRRGLLSLESRQTATGEAGRRQGPMCIRAALTLLAMDEQNIRREGLAFEALKRRSQAQLAKPNRTMH